MTPPASGKSSKAEALSRGRRQRRPDGAPSATPLPNMPSPPDSANSGPADTAPAAPAPPGRAAPGQGRRGHLRKISVEMYPDEHDRLKLWLLNAFGGGAKATPIIKALLAEAYSDPALTDRIRRRLDQREQSRD